MEFAIDCEELSRSAIVADTATGCHLLTIHGYSDTKKTTPTGNCVKSRPFIVGEHRWRIEYYPNGISSEVADYVSLALLLDDDVGAAAVKAQYELGISLEMDGWENLWREMRLDSSPVHDFASGSGWRQKRPRFIREVDMPEYLNDDSFTIRCDIVVFHDCRAVEEDAVVSSAPPCDLRKQLGELLESEQGADVVFEVGGETVAAHRYVLAARSPVFAAELLGPMKEGTTADAVRVEDMEPDPFKALLRYAYTGSLPETSSEEDEAAVYQHLLVAADRYGIGRLKLMCEEKLRNYIEVGTVATILALAEQHRCDGLKKACLEFIAAPTNLGSVVGTDGFRHLSVSCPSIMVELIAMLRIH